MHRALHDVGGVPAEGRVDPADQLGRGEALGVHDPDHVAGAHLKGSVQLSWLVLDQVAVHRDDHPGMLLGQAARVGHRLVIVVSDADHDLHSRMVLAQQSPYGLRHHEQRLVAARDDETEGERLARWRDIRFETDRFVRLRSVPGVHHPSQGGAGHRQQHDGDGDDQDIQNDHGTDPRESTEQGWRAIAPVHPRRRSTARLMRCPARPGTRAAAGREGSAFEIMSPTGVGQRECSHFGLSARRFGHAPEQLHAGPSPTPGLGAARQCFTMVAG